jgi:alpha-beta hydrolase superfamily lysophospholipase
MLLISLRYVSVSLAVFVGLLIAACSGPQMQTYSDIQQPAAWEEASFVMDDTYRLPYESHSIDRAPERIFIALHGFNDYHQAFSDFCAFMQTRHSLCVAYDQRGFGDTVQRGIWPGETRLRKDLMAIITLVRSRYPEVPLYVVGESMGGAVILTALQTNQDFWRANVQGAVLFAPAVWSRETQPWYQRWGLALATTFVPSWQPTGEGLGVVASDNVEALRGLGRDPLVIKATRIDAIYGLNNLMDQAFADSQSIPIPTLWLYGGNDQLVPLVPTCQVAQRLSSNEGDRHTFSFYFLPEGYHMLTRDLDRVENFRLVDTWQRQLTRMQSSRRNDISVVCEPNKANY